MKEKIKIEQSWRVEDIFDGLKRHSYEYQFDDKKRDEIQKSEDTYLILIFYFDYK